MKQIKKEFLNQVLQSWSKGYTVLAPARKENGDVLLGVYDEAAFTLDYRKPSLPPKQALLPQSDVTFRVEDGRYSQSLPQGRTLLFGIRSCDLKGLLQSKDFMSSRQGPFSDIYFEARANNTVTVVMACPGPQSPSCFCTTTRSGPWADQGYDLQLTDTGEDFIVEVGSPAGEALVANAAFTEMKGNGAGKKLQGLRKEASESIPVIPEISKAMEKLKGPGAADEVWERFGNKCITCGGCSFVCPTCTCFNVYDRVTGEGAGERLRTWDTCLYGGFTKEASGHNPRGSRALRLKRRHEHKLLYFNDRENFGALGTCVGCGRCSDSCPVHIGSIEVAKAIVKA